MGTALHANTGTPSGAGKKINDIQMLRGVAIVMVLCCHLSFSSTLLSALPVKLTNPFYAGVELFFVISGFVVTRSLIRGNYEPVGFLIKRAFRLYPPILAFLVLSGIVNAAVRVSGWSSFATSFFSVPLTVFANQATAILGGYLINLGQDSSYMNGAMWSLSVEFQFYATVAGVAVCALMARAAPRRVGYIVMAGAATIYALCTYSRVLLTSDERSSLINYLISYEFDFMALGVLLAYVPDSVLRRAFRFGPLWSVGVVFLPIVVLSLCRSPLVTNGSGPDYLVGLGLPLTALCYTALVALAVGGNVSRILPLALQKILFLIGERSYTIYLLHFTTMLVAWVIIVMINPSWTENAWSYAIAQPVFTLLVLLPVTELVYRRLELPSIGVGGMIVSAYLHRRASFAL
jgi:peptidoglycan/LPS O-acetylase OafA/YrhL